MALEDEPSRHQGLVQLLESSGFAYGSRSATNLLLLDGFSIETLLKITLAALHTPSPDMALNGFERLAGVVERSQLVAVVAHRRRLTQFMMLCGSSPFLTNLIYREPRFFTRLFVGNELEQSRSRSELLGSLRRDLPEQADMALLMKTLRCFKRFEILRIAARDLNGLASLEEVTRELSDLASATLQVALETSQSLLVCEHGLPLTTEGRQAAMTVIGMGKLGGRELNFSSDIDIIYFYETDQGETAGIDDGRGGRKGVVSLHAFFNKLAELTTRAMHQITEDGFVFRVDVGLRPEGKSGDMAVSLRSAEIYYESWGQSWERTAMLKARPVAGSKELGEQLLQTLSPFVYRKYLDYTLIEDMKLMKQKIDASLARNREGEQNLKLGRGGIREIEFFIQALQLVYAGKTAKLRERNSLFALELLREARLISEEDCRHLSEAYRFLRTVEHRIQVVQERQTHSLPAKEDEMIALARRCGFLRENGVQRFREVLEQHRSRVSAIYGGLFYEQEQTAQQQVNPEILYLLDAKADPDLVKDMLAQRGLEDVDRAFDNLAMLRGGALKRNTTERIRRILSRIAPPFLQALLESPDPDMALASTERFFAAVSGRSATFALLAENREALKLLATLFGTSEFLSKILISHPELLEAMVSRTYASMVKPREVMSEELCALLLQAEDFEAQLDVLRRYRHEEFLRIGLNDIHGHLSQGSITLQLTSLAEVCLEAAFGIATAELARFGRPCYLEEGRSVSAGMAIIGMGKMGGRELNYHSDLDIIFIYDRQGMTDGGKQITNHEYFAKLAQKLISVLSTQTREGYVYKLDTRLRPSGNAGPLVTSLESFAQYHRNEAQVWERQALSKARVVLGEPELAGNIAEVLSQAVFGASLDDEGRREIHRLRMRMENEIAREREGAYNIKTGRGGMVDVEFVAQYLQLRHGWDHQQLRIVRTVDVINEAGALGLLLLEDAEALVSGYKFLRKLENRLRLIHDHSINDLGGDQRYLDKLARRLGYDPKLRHPGRQLMQDYGETTEKIRNVYDRILGDQAGAEEEKTP
ncbi:bifunctional [glutamate--ammonia ligase]-adenylyl-L-tyrosine phosphorylase/[glutamate--ammonia-ligase] adenylyltransferase [Trichlorobacter ammonificans]|nr:bifunctional [glutamate--ammonia ligase]-adenylyl-L-tyrosine phosphorylase/[glutamate--ammonia-ligase] adenylyltransferase [Trichlorobacter ammonificans]